MNSLLISSGTSAVAVFLGNLLFSVSVLNGLSAIDLIGLSVALYVLAKIIASTIEDLLPTDFVSKLGGFNLGRIGSDRFSTREDKLCLQHQRILRSR